MSYVVVVKTQVESILCIFSWGNFLTWIRPVNLSYLLVLGIFLWILYPLFWCRGTFSEGTSWYVDFVNALSRWSGHFLLDNWKVTMIFVLISVGDQVCIFLEARAFFQCLAIATHISHGHTASLWESTCMSQLVLFSKKTISAEFAI